MPKEDSNVSWTIMKEIVFGCCVFITVFQHSVVMGLRLG